MKLIIGLGNPGRKYSQTRHNVGWLVLDALAEKEKWQENKRSKFYYLTKEINNQEVVLVKPTTFMNQSGLAMAYLKKKNPKLKLADIMVVHDDKDLDFGRIKLAKNSSSAGHKGVESIINALGSQDFTRVRVGVKNELLNKMETDKFVLSKFNREERKELKNIIEKTAELIKENI